jgi:hypothetical protein
MHTTNYRDTFILVSPDCPVHRAFAPPRPGTIAALQYERITAAPYRLTSDELLFGIYADRNGIAMDERPSARATFFSKGQPCLRSSPLVKSFGWGIHHDERGRIAVYAVESPEYAELAARDDVVKLAGMRSSRAQ